MTSTLDPETPVTVLDRAQRGTMSKPRGRVATAVMLVLALIWIFPLFWAVLNSFRDYDYTQQNGYLSFGGWTFDNYQLAWENGDLGKYFLNSLIITVPAVVLTIFLASLVGFVLSRFSYRFNLLLLGVFLAANLLPPQALLVPIFRMYREIPLPAFMSDSEQLLGSYWGLIAINIAFQLGFCTFVLSNYMKTLPSSSTRRPRWTGRACGGSTGSSPCRWSARPSRPWRRCRPPGSTTSSSGRPCCWAGTATSSRSPAP